MFAFLREIALFLQDCSFPMESVSVYCDNKLLCVDGPGANDAVATYWAYMIPNLNALNIIVDH